MLVKLGLIDFINRTMRLLKLSKKPGRVELWQSIKVSFIGIALVGLMGFVIKYLSGVIQGFTG